MALHPIEEATLRAFVVSSRRDRLLTLLGNPKRRSRALNTLNHFDDWDERFTHPVKSSVDIIALLRQAGAPPECYVTSDDDELDGRRMPLDDAIRACEEFDFASIVCCIAGKLAFFFDEDGPAQSLPFASGHQCARFGCPVVIFSASQRTCVTEYSIPEVD